MSCWAELAAIQCCYRLWSVSSAIVHCQMVESIHSIASQCKQELVKWLATIAIKTLALGGTILRMQVWNRRETTKSLLRLGWKELLRSGWLVCWWLKGGRMVDRSGELIWNSMRELNSRRAGREGIWRVCRIFQGNEIFFHECQRHIPHASAYISVYDYSGNRRPNKLFQFTLERLVTLQPNRKCTINIFIDNQSPRNSKSKRKRKKNKNQPKTTIAKFWQDNNSKRNFSEGMKNS